MSVRDEVQAAATRIGLPRLELRTSLAQACADGRIPEELALAHVELVEYMLAGQPHGAPRLPRGATEAMLPTPPPGGGFYAAPGHLVLSLEGIEALASDAGIHLLPGKIAAIYARAEKMPHGMPGELLDRMHEFLAHLAHAADHPSAPTQI